MGRRPCGAGSGELGVSALPAARSPACLARAAPAQLVAVSHALRRGCGWASAIQGQGQPPPFTGGRKAPRTGLSLAPLMSHAHPLANPCGLRVQTLCWHPPPRSCHHVIGPNKDQESGGTELARGGGGRASHVHLPEDLSSASLPKRENGGVWDLDFSESHPWEVALHVIQVATSECPLCAARWPASPPPAETGGPRFTARPGCLSACLSEGGRYGSSVMFGLETRLLGPVRPRASTYARPAAGEEKQGPRGRAGRRPGRGPAREQPNLQPRALALAGGCFALGQFCSPVRACEG